MTGYLDPLKNSYKRRCDVKFWLFSEPWAHESGIDSWNGNTVWNVFVPYDLDDELMPIATAYPKWSLVKPGEDVVIYGNASFVRGGGAVGSYSWEVVSGSADLSGGQNCTVRPTGGEGSEVIVKLTVTDSARSTENYTLAYIACSENGWIWPTGRLRLSGALGVNFDTDPGGWSGELTCAGSFVDPPDAGDILLVHIETHYDEQKQTYGGYGRNENLCILRVKEVNYRNRGRYGVTTVKLGPLHDAVKPHTITRAFDDLPVIYVGPAYANTSTLSLPELENVYQCDDFRASDAAFHIVTETHLSTYFNCDLYHDANQYPNLLLEYEADLWTMLGASIAKSLMLKAWFDKRGALVIAPQPGIRQGTYYDNETYLWPSTTPLTTDYCAYDPIITWRDNEQFNRIDLSGPAGDGSYVEVTATVDDKQGERVNKSGFLLPDEEAAGDWAEDVLDHINRSWDASVTFYCPGNIFKLASHLYVNLEPNQGGMAAATGIGIVHQIEHNFDLDHGRQVTTVKMYHLAGS